MQATTKGSGLTTFEFRRVVRSARAAALQRTTRPNPRRVMFCSFNGQFSDNPRALYEELAKRKTAHVPLWVASPDDANDLPQGAVKLYSPAYYRAVGRTGLLIANAQMPRNLPARPGMTYLQTWHGTPLKRLGYDNPQWRAGAMERELGRDVQKWDYLISPNPYSSAIFRHAFRYEGPILETGYPRNDVLLSPTSTTIRAATRRQLGIEEGQFVVLYAPTWRDDVRDAQGNQSYQQILDLDLVGNAVSSQATVLVRLHYAINSGSLATSPGVIDVTRYPDIRDLYLAADMLVTDYSSTMFDFAVTRKPIVLFTPDIAKYESSTRGFYFDLVAQAPGPMCTEDDELIDIIRAPEPTARAGEASYSEFRKTYCPWDDGGASARVLNAVLTKAD